MQVYWLDMFSSRYFVEIFQKYLGKCTLLKNKESAVYCTPCPREVDCFSYNESSHKGMMGRKKKKKKVKIFENCIYGYYPYDNIILTYVMILTYTVLGSISTKTKYRISI